MANEYDENNPLGRPNNLPPYKKFHRPYHKRYNFQPFYDDRNDYNTNAKSYYDYLARFQGNEDIETWALNRLLRRNLKVLDTNTVDMTKIGDWIDNGTCSTTFPPNNYDDVITLQCKVILSAYTKVLELSSITGSPFTIGNAITARNDGLWAPDYTSVISGLNKTIGDIYNRLEEIENEINDQGDVINQINNAMQKIIDNLFESGAITTNVYNTFEFTGGSHIAYGNINHYGLATDGNYFIKTAKNSPAGSTTLGV